MLRPNIGLAVPRLPFPSRIPVHPEQARARRRRLQTRGRRARPTLQLRRPECRLDGQILVNMHANVAEMGSADWTICVLVVQQQGQLNGLVGRSRYMCFVLLLQ